MLVIYFAYKLNLEIKLLAYSIWETLSCLKMYRLPNEVYEHWSTFHLNWYVYIKIIDSYLDDYENKMHYNIPLTVVHWNTANHLCFNEYHCLCDIMKNSYRFHNYSKYYYDIVCFFNCLLFKKSDEFLTESLNFKRFSIS